MRLFAKNEKKWVLMLLQNIFCAIPQKNSVFYFKCRVLEYKNNVYINRSYLIFSCRAGGGKEHIKHYWHVADRIHIIIGIPKY